MTTLFKIDFLISFLCQYLSTNSVTNAITIPEMSTTYTPIMLCKPIRWRDKAERLKYRRYLKRTERFPIHSTFLNTSRFQHVFKCTGGFYLMFAMLDETNNRSPIRFSVSSSASSIWIESLSTRVFETRTATGRKHFSCQDSGSSHIFTLIISNGEKILRNINVVVWRQVKRENSSLPVAVRVSKTCVLKLPNISPLPSVSLEVSCKITKMTLLPIFFSNLLLFCNNL